MLRLFVGAITARIKDPFSGDDVSEDDYVTIGRQESGALEAQQYMLMSLPRWQKPQCGEIIFRR